MGTALLGTGAALLGVGAAACKPSPGVSGAATAGAAGSAPSAKPGYAVLGPDWTGPGGVGDYATSNGNVHETVNAAHALRDNYWQKEPAASGTEEQFDVVIVGGGISGLMAAYELVKHRGAEARVLILDNNPMFGGEAKQNELEIDGHHLYAPQGSNMFLWPPKTTATVSTFYHPAWQEVGLPMGGEAGGPEWLTTATGTDKPLRFTKDNYMAMMVGRRRAQQVQFFRDAAGKWQPAKNPWERGYQDFPWPEAARRELIHLDDFELKSPPKDLEQWLDTMTYKDYLTKVAGVTQKEVFDYIDPMISAYGTGLGCDAISALAAYKFRAPGLAPPQRPLDPNVNTPPPLLEPVSFPGGNSGIARHFVKRLIPDAIGGKDSFHDVVYGTVNWSALDRADQPVRIRVASTAIDVRHDGDAGSATHAWVTYVDNKTGKFHKTRSKAVIMAGGQWMNKHVVRDAPAAVLAAMGEFNHAPMLVVNVGVRHWRFLEKMGATSARWLGGAGWFTNIRAPMSIAGQHMPLDPNKPAVLTFYNPYTCFAPGIANIGMSLKAQCIAARTALWAMPYRDIENSMRTQLAAAFAEHGFDHQRDIAALIANRWGHAYVAPQPGFYFSKDGNPTPSDIVRRGYGRVRFSHSELTGDQIWSTACEEGERAAKQVLEFA